MQSAASDLLLIEAAAREAGAMAAAAFGKQVKTWSKGAAGPVTEVDLAIDKMLRKTLMAERPQYGWLSEESPDNTERLARQRVFIIDPIDGTQAFIANQPEFTISIGLSENGRALAGAVFNPIKDEMYLGVVGQGASLNGAPISASPRAGLEGASLIGKQAFYASKHWTRPWPALNLAFRPSIAYRLALVAAGAYDGVVLAGFKNEWDIAAGAAIVEAASGRVTDPWGAEIAFNQPNPRAPGMVASGAPLHPLLIERLVDLPDPRHAESIKDAAP